MHIVQVLISYLVLCFRLSAEYGGAFLLSTAVDEIVMDDGKVKAVKCEGKASVFTWRKSRSVGMFVENVLQHNSSLKDCLSVFVNSCSTVNSSSATPAMLLIE